MLQIEAALKDCLGQPGLLPALSLQLQQATGFLPVSEAVEENGGSADIHLPSIELIVADAQVERRNHQSTVLAEDKEESRSKSGLPVSDSTGRLLTQPSAERLEADEQMRPASIAASSSQLSTVLAGDKEESQPRLGLPMSQFTRGLPTQPSAEHVIAALEANTGQQATGFPVDSSGSELVRPRRLNAKEQYEEGPQPYNVEAVVGRSERPEAAVAAAQDPAWQFDESSAAVLVSDTESSSGSRGKSPSLAEELRIAAEQQRQGSYNRRAAANGLNSSRGQGAAGQYSRADVAQAVVWSDQLPGVESGAATADDGAAVGDAVFMGDAVMPAKHAIRRTLTPASRQNATRAARAVAAGGQDDSSDEEDNLANTEPPFRLHLPRRVRALMRAVARPSAKLLRFFTLQHSDLCPTYIYMCIYMIHDIYV